MTPHKRIGIWLRVSTEMQVLGDSPEHHEQRARYYCEAKEWVKHQTYEDCRAALILTKDQ